MNKLDTIRARWLSEKQGYAVHVGCLSEATPDNPLGTRYFCEGCHEHVAPEFIAEVGQATKSYIDDVGHLLQLIEERGR